MTMLGNKCSWCEDVGVSMCGGMSFYVGVNAGEGAAM
jgi:hypothetical protein